MGRSANLVRTFERLAYQRLSKGVGFEFKSSSTLFFLAFGDDKVLGDEDSGGVSTGSVMANWVFLIRSDRW